MESLRSTKINNLTYHASSGKDNDSFIGLKIKGNDIYFYYPEAFNFDTNNIKEDIISILKTISLSATKKKDNTELFTDRINETDFALNSYLWIIKDYLNNGFYINREKVLKLNQNGKVNWKKTLETNPIISEKNIIYNNIVVETKNNIDNLLVEAHKYCVKKSIDYIGWIFNLRSSHIILRPFNDVLKKEYLRAITSELNHSFEDDKKIRLNHMKNVILGLDAKLEGKDIIYGVDSYHVIYEKMIDRIFSNTDVSEFYPKGTWKIIKPYNKTASSSNLRPDTVFINIKDNKTKDAYILDSKYYRFGTTGRIEDLPETTSIQKQIVYGDFVKTNKRKEFDNIYNAFLLPFNKEAEMFKTNDDMVYVGNAVTDSSDLSSSHETVYAFLIDLKHIIKTWNSNNHYEDIKFLVSEIDKLAAKQV